MIRSRPVVVALTSAAVLAAALLAPAAAHAATARVPGTPVAPLPPVDQSANGGTNTVVSRVPATSVLGRPDPGVVPTVGSASARADDGAFVAYESRVNGRTVDLVVSSPALGGAAPVRVFLPRTWSSAPTRTYPVLYLLPGASEKADYQAWSLYTTAADVTAKAAALIVMPSVGSTGIGTNWTGTGGRFQYDTFLATELPQLLQRGYRATNRQAVAGISTGGYTAVALAALHPGAYRAAASYSGLLTPSVPVMSQLVQTLLLREGKNPFALWGDPLLGYFTWRAHDPSTFASRLKGTALYLSAGNGVHGALDPPGFGVDALEPSVLTSTRAMQLSLTLAGVPATSDLYGAGTHSWPYWNREFARSWPMLATALGV